MALIMIGHIWRGTDPNVTQDELMDAVVSALDQASKIEGSHPPRCGRPPCTLDEFLAHSSQTLPDS